MYQPKKYKKTGSAYIFNFIKEFPFASFVLNGERILATHIPVLPEGTSEDFLLFGHIANHNEQYQYLKDGTEALLIFQGPQGYVSSSWYKEKDISTWDYSAVHINVRIKLQSGEELEASLKKLVERFEKEQENPLWYEDIPLKMLEDHLPLITGFWCEPIKIEALAKLHQAYDKDDVDSVIRHLNEQGNCPLSNQIKKEHDL
ncbi:FMN-binding negative transcriptional regulator [Salegentibacter sp. HM20]